jgi:hypothetical protein
MKDFIINLLTLILMITPFISIVLSLASIANGDGFGFAMFLLLGFISSGLDYRILKDKQTDYENK